MLGECKILKHNQVMLSSLGLSQMKGRGTNICKKCGEQFKVGDLVIKQYRSGKITRSVNNYHGECWKRMHY